MDSNGDPSFVYPTSARKPEYPLTIMPRNSVDPRYNQMVAQSRSNWAGQSPHLPQSSMSISHIENPQFQSSTTQLTHGTNAWELPAVPSKKDSSQTNNTTSVTKKCTNQCSKLNATHLVFLMIGLMVCGIPLAVMATLWANERASVSQTSAETTVAATTAPRTLPVQCSAYAILNDLYRNYNNFYSCCPGPSDSIGSMSSGWYRIMGQAGSQLYSSTIFSTNQCAAFYPGYFNGTLPTTIGGMTTGGVCFANGGSCAATTSPISVINCNGFYVYYLQSTINSNYKYCTN